MATYIKTLVDKDGNTVLPKTRSSAVYMSDNSTLESKISSLNNTINGKANTSHVHDASNITSGVVPLIRGGTGASDGLGARNNLQTYRRVIFGCNTNKNGYWYKFASITIPNRYTARSITFLITAPNDHDIEGAIITINIATHNDNQPATFIVTPITTSISSYFNDLYFIINNDNFFDNSPWICELWYYQTVTYRDLVFDVLAETNRDRKNGYDDNFGTWALFQDWDNSSTNPGKTSYTSGYKAYSFMNKLIWSYQPMTDYTKSRYRPCHFSTSVPSSLTNGSICLVYQ